jgi:hypothetical protein
VKCGKFFPYFARSQKKPGTVATPSQPFLERSPEKSGFRRQIDARQCFLS